MSVPPNDAMQIAFCMSLRIVDDGAGEGVCHNEARRSVDPFTENITAARERESKADVLSHLGLRGVRVGRKVYKGVW